MIKNNIINTARSISFNTKRNKVLKKYNKMKLPNLWLFTDSLKTLKPIELSKRLPKKSGLVIRHYNSKNKTIILKDILHIKKRRMFTVLISGKYKRGLNIDGNHFPQWANPINNGNKITSMSFHHAKDIRKSINLKADLIFISPVFPSTSHKNKQCLGVIKLGLMARLFKKHVIALGGINNKNITRLRSLPISGCAGIELFTENF
jgi:thiamine-phosphate pyrophosphorylase